MPKPGAATEPADPWRERIAQLEVQAQATRALAQRTTDEAAATRQRAEAAEAKVKELEAELRSRVTALESRPVVTESAPSAAVTPETPAERIEQAVKVAQQARVALDTIQQDLAEQSRLFAARKARLDSFESRVTKMETDPRFTELGRKVEAFDLRLSTLLPQLEAAAALVPRIEALESALRDRVAAVEASLAEVPGQIQSALATLEERGPATGKKAKVESGLRAIKGIGPKLEKQLTELGVTTPEQIAAWTEEELAEWAERLGSTVAKIKKAGWVEAARAARG